MIFISFHIFFLTKLAPGFFYFILNINENHMNIKDSMFYIFSNFIEKKKKSFSIVLLKLILIFFVFYKVYVSKLKYLM